MSVLALAVLSCAPVALADHDAAKTAINSGNDTFFLRDFVAAEAIYTTAITEDPPWAVPHNNRGLARFKQGNLAGAIDDLTNAISLDAAYPGPRLNRGKCYAAQKQWALAEADFNTGLAISANDARFLYNLGWVLDEQGQYEQAVEKYEAALARSPNHVKARVALGITKAKLAEADEAIEHFYQAIREADSGDFNVQLAAYNLQLLRGPGVSFDSDAAAADYVAGIFLFVTEQFDPATAKFSSARAAESDVPDIPWCLYWTCLKTGQNDRASVHLDRARKLQEGLYVESFVPGATIYIDGVKRGETPTVLYLFPSEYEITLRMDRGGTLKEWVGRTYTDGTSGGGDHMLLNPVTVTDFSRFQPVDDVDRDWLADVWETHWFGHLAHGPASDETDHDGLLNLYEHWFSTDPTDADTDGDGRSDYDEVHETPRTNPLVPNRFFYVNDGSTTNDTWCTAAGSNANSGTSPAAPKATVQAILSAYDLEPGDVVRIDTGTYVLTSNITVSPQDGGSSDSPVTFEASPYGVTIDRSSMGFDTRAWHVDGAQYVTITTAASNRHPSVPQRWMKVTGADYGLYLAGSYAHVSRLDVKAYSYTGIHCTRPSTIENCLVNGAISPSGFGINLGPSASGSAVRNCTIADSGTYGLYMSFVSSITAVNNIILADGAGNHAVSSNSSSFATCNYNILYVTNGASLGVTPGRHSFTIAPEFVSTATGDYHLRSSAGSYHDGAWSPDAADSIGIDTGTGSVGNEPSPNSTPMHPTGMGARNMGAYGGTEQASKTPTTRRVWLYEPVGGENYLDPAIPVDIRWTWVGTAWQADDTARLEYSVDSGQQWQDVADGSATRAGTGQFSWDVSSLNPSPLCRVRITPNSPSRHGHLSPEDFRIGLDATFYVNDGSTSGDSWCTAAGNDANNGLTPETPKATVQAILSTYDLAPGDVVRIDTGTYLLTSNITVGSQDGGSAGSPVTFEASPYGVTIDRNSLVSGSYAWHVDGAEYVTITTAASDEHPLVPQRWMKLTRAYYGLYLAGSHAHASRLEVADCSYMGINSSERSTIENCLVRDTLSTSGYGINLGPAADSSTVSNCTIVNSGKYGLYLSSAGSITAVNNIVQADGAGNTAISSNNSSFATRDYNNLYVTNGASLGVTRGTHSFSVDPAFVDAATDDYHIQSSAGSYHNDAWTSDGTDSIGIDTGTGSVGNEPSPNSTPLHTAGMGARNMGAYGGTEQASKTPTTRRAWLYEPVGGEKYLDSTIPVDIRWTWVGTTWQPGDTAKLDSSDDSGQHWQDVVGGDAVDITSYTFAWDISPLIPSPMYRVRITPNSPSHHEHMSPEDFRIGRGLTFYVNDGSTTNDNWCTAVGNDANEGRTPSTPKATVQSVLAEHDLSGGDVVRIDTGTYVLTSNITVGSLDGGSADSPVTFEASPYGVTIDRNLTAANSRAWHVDSAQYVTITTVASNTLPSSVPQRWMKVTGADYGLYLAGSYVNVSRLDVTGNSYTGIYCAQRSTIENCLVRATTIPAGYGIYLESTADNSTVRNCTIADTGSCGLYLSSASSITAVNNIILADGDGNTAISSNNSSFATRDYNNLYVTNGASPGVTRGEHSLGIFPAFVSAGAGDYHLESTVGSYHDGAWTADATDSIGIDTGSGDAGDEPAPNSTPMHMAGMGARNMGAYGGTEQASKTPATRYVWLYEPVGGEEYLDPTIPVDIRWTWVGTNWQTGDTVKLDYSADSGQNWQDVVGGRVVQAESGTFSWDINSMTPSALYRVKITPNVPSFPGHQTVGDFRIGRNLTFYVNDGSTTNNTWCTAAGNDANNGLTPKTPKATVQAILSTYNLAPGDVVRIDTGTYLLTSNITVGSQDGGSAGSPVTFEASPYGVTIDRNSLVSGSYAWHVDGAEYVTITTAASDEHPLVPQRWMKLTRAYYGLYLAGSHAHASRLEVADCSYMGINSSERSTIENCLVRDTLSTSGYGINLGPAADSSTVSNCTIVNSGKYGLYLSSAGSITAVNNIVQADGAGNYAIFSNSSSFATRDYNALYVTNGASLGVTPGAHSFSAVPGFVSAAAGDYHLQSRAGSYHNGTWVKDVANSLCIDAADPASGFDDELQPNGGRANIGAYGNTEQASHTEQLTLMVNDADAAEAGPDTGEFIITRTGSTSGPLTVNYTTTGSTATLSGVSKDIEESLTGTVVIPAGQASATLTITPRDDELWNEDAEEVTITLAPGAGYSIGAPATGTVTIAENDIDGVAPTVEAVYVDSTSWTPEFRAALNGRNKGFAIAAGGNQLKPLSWTNINVIRIQFSESVIVGSSHLQLKGVNTPSYSLPDSGFSYDQATRTARWQLGAPLGVDKLRLILSETVADLAGNPLDGAWTDAAGTWPSGQDGTPTAFSFRLNTLCGDCSRNGNVNLTDVLDVRNRQLTVPGQPQYSIHYDVNGTGSIDLSDVLGVRNRQFTSLPSAEPAE